MPEEWRDIPSAPGYQASSLGRVRSLDRMVLGRDGREELHRGKVLKPQSMRNGYVEVFIRDGKRRKHRTVHTLVAEAFIGERPKGADVMHLNGDRSDNRAVNLCYGTRSENLRQTYSYGGKQANGKLSLEDVDEVRLRLLRGESVSSIAASFDVNISTICHVRDGKSFAWYKGGENNSRNTRALIPQ